MEKVTLNIGHLPIMDHLTLGISHKKDNASFKNVQINPIKFQSWDDLAYNLEKDLDGAFILAPYAIKLRSKGIPVKVILLGHRLGMVFVVRNDINSIKELKGKTIGVPHKFSTHNIFLHQMLRQANLQSGGDVKVITIAPPEFVSNLESGKIDGYVCAEPFGTEAEIRGIGKVLSLSKDIKEHHIDCILVMKERILAKYPKAIEELVESLIKSGIYIHQNYKEAIKIAAGFLDKAENIIEHTLTLDKVDLDILELLRDDARLPIYKIANKLQTTATVVKYRIKKLIDNNVIHGFRTKLNINLLGYQHIKVFLLLENKDVRGYNQLMYSLREHSNIIRTVKSIGYSELEIDLIVKSIADFDKIMKEIKYKYTQIKDYKFMLIYGEY